MSEDLKVGTKVRVEYDATVSERLDPDGDYFVEYRTPDGRDRTGYVHHSAVTQIRREPQMGDVYRTTKGSLIVVSDKPDGSLRWLYATGTITEHNGFEIESLFEYHPDAELLAEGR